MSGSVASAARPTSRTIHVIGVLSLPYAGKQALQAPADATRGAARAGRQRDRSAYDPSGAGPAHP